MFLGVPVVLFVPLIGEFTLFNILILIIGLVIIWVIISIPVYIAGKIVTAGQSSIFDAMISTMFGPITYIVTLLIVDFALGSLIGSGAYIWALIFAFIAWVGVFRTSFRTTWLRTLAIAITAIFIFAVVSIVFSALLGIMVPAPFFPRF